jgi:menaquinone-9 beta-reductase
LVADNFMAIGDAGSLIDPFTGEGIGNAMWSGHKAALVAIKAIKKKYCTKENLMEYQHIVNRGLGAELKLSHRLQQLSNQHWLMNMVVKKASSNKELQQLMSSMFEQVDVRAKLSNPLFYLRLLRS